MSKIIITYKDWVKCNIQGLNPFDKSNLINEFKVFIPSARHQPTYKLGMWDGYIRYFEQTGNTYVSLLPEILNKININNYDGIEYIYPSDLKLDVDLGNDIDKTYMSNIKWNNEHRLAGQPIILEEHQVRVVNKFLHTHRGVMSVCTGAGKTLITAALFKKVKPFGKSLIIVPSQDLAFQSTEDYKSWGLDVGIVGCGLREFGHDVTVCTWQTLNVARKSESKKTKTEKEELTLQELEKLKQDLICLIFDEAHQCKGHQIKAVLEQSFKNIPIRIGLTGTINKDKSEQMCLKTAIGEIFSERVDAKELQDKGFLSNCQINCIRLKDTTICANYKDEMDYLINNDERITFIANLIAQLSQTNNNTLVFVDRKLTGKLLYEKLFDIGIDVVSMNGDIKQKKRKDEYKSINNTNNKCLICTSGISSTGLNIPRLYNLVFIDYGKSFTKVIQSIGRGLRKANDKDFVTIFDISSTMFYSKKHFNDRIHFYEDAKYPYQIYNIDKWK